MKKFLLVLVCFVILLFSLSAAQSAPLSVVLTGTPSGIMAGEVITYTAVISNPSGNNVVITNNATARYEDAFGLVHEIVSNTVSINMNTTFSGVSFIGNIPVGTTFVGGSVTVDNVPVSVTLVGNTFTVLLGDMVGGTEKRVSFKVTAN